MSMQAPGQPAVKTKNAAATRESVSRMVGHGHEDVDFAVLLQETARDAGLELVPEQVQVSDGLES